MQKQTAGIFLVRTLFRRRFVHKQTFNQKVYGELHNIRSLDNFLTLISGQNNMVKHVLSRLNFSLASFFNWLPMFRVKCVSIFRLSAIKDERSPETYKRRRNSQDIGTFSHERISVLEHRFSKLLSLWISRGTHREYSSKPLKHSIVKRILVNIFHLFFFFLAERLVIRKL